jgi:hypothetical protein
MNPSPWNATWAEGENLALTTKILGQWNRLAKDEKVVTNPGCGQ